MWTQLRRIAPRLDGLDVVSLEAAKSHCRIAPNDIADDTDLTDFIKSAVDCVEGPEGIGVALSETAWRLSLDCLPTHIRIPIGPVTGVTSITYIDGEGVTQTLPSELYRYDLDADPMTIVPASNANWPAAEKSPGSVKIVFTAGYAQGAIPGDLIQAIKAMIGHNFENREAVIVGHEAFEVPMTTKMTLDNHRRGVIS